jgi:hypothetical protein
MSDRRAGWLLVIVSGALGVMVTLLAYAMVFSRGALNGASSAGEAAIILLVAAAPGILMIVALDVIAFFVGKELLLRIVAGVVSVLTIVGVVVAGAMAAQAGDPPATAYWAAAGNAPGPFDCAALNSDTPAEMQAALDELDHPEPVEIYIAGEQTCAAMLDTAPESAIADYVPQLQDAGWTIDSQSPGWLSAKRSGYVLWVTGCWPDESRSAVAIFVDRYRYGLSCDDTEP